MTSRTTCWRVCQSANLSTIGAGGYALTAATVARNEKRKRILARIILISLSKSAHRELFLQARVLSDLRLLRLDFFDQGEEFLFLIGVRRLGVTERNVAAESRQNQRDEDPLHDSDY